MACLSGLCTLQSLHMSQLKQPRRERNQHLRQVEMPASAVCRALQHTARPSVNLSRNAHCTSSWHCKDIIRLASQCATSQGAVGSGFIAYCQAKHRMSRHAHCASSGFLYAWPAAKPLHTALARHDTHNCSCNSRCATIPLSDQLLSALQQPTRYPAP